MEGTIFHAINSLFVNFREYGNFNDEEIFKILAVTIIRDMLFFDWGFLEDSDIREVMKAYNKLLGESCQLPMTIQNNNC